MGPFGKFRNVSLKLQNLVHFHGPFFANHAYFTPHDRPPLLKGHHLGWPLQRGSPVLIGIGSGTGLVPSGTQPLPEPMLTQVYVAICVANHAYFTPHGRPPLLKGHILGWPLQRHSPVLVSMGSGTGLVPSGNRPSPEPMLTQIYVAICVARRQSALNWIPLLWYQNVGKYVTFVDFSHHWLNQWRIALMHMPFPIRRQIIILINCELSH